MVGENAETREINKIRVQHIHSVIVFEFMLVRSFFIIKQEPGIICSYHSRHHDKLLIKFFLFTNLFC